MKYYKVALISMMAGVLVSLASCSRKTGETSAKSSANSGEAETVYTFKYGQAQPKEGARGQSMEKLKELLESRSNGRIQVENYYSAQLGNERSLMDQVATGVIQGMRGGTFRDANPKFGLLELPFLFDGWKDAIAFLRSSVVDKMRKDAEKNGYHVPAIGITQGFRAYTNNVRPITEPEDLRGLKMRVPPGSDVYLQIAQLLGEQPVEIPGADIYSALKLGTIDGQDNPPNNIYDLNIYEAQKYLSINNYTTGPDPLMISLQWYQSLPQDLQGIFDNAAQEAMAYSDQLLQEQEAGVLKKFGDLGIKINYITPENIQKFKDILLGPTYQAAIDSGLTTQVELDEFQAQIAKLR